MTRSFVGRADLLRLAATASDDDLRRLAELAGFRTDPSYVHQEDDPAGHKPPPAFKKWSNRLEKKAIGLAPLRGTPFVRATRGAVVALALGVARDAVPVHAREKLRGQLPLHGHLIAPVLRQRP